MKLDAIAAKQEEGLLLLRKLGSNYADSGQDVDDILTSQMENMEEVQVLCRRWEDGDFRKKMVIALVCLPCLVTLAGVTNIHFQIKGFLLFHERL